MSFFVNRVKAMLGKSFPRQALRLVGVALTLVCCYFVFRSIQSSAITIGSRLFSRDVIFAVIGCSILWVALNGTLGLLWRTLLSVGGSGISRRDSVLLSFRTQIAKYLPGNVFHLAGRVVLAGRYGVSKSQAGMATLAEALILVSVAVAISVRLFWSLEWGRPALVIAFLFLGATTIVFRKSLARLLAKRELGIGYPRSLAIFGKAFCYSVVVFSIQALMFVWVELALFDDAAVTLFNRIEIVASSWAAGFVVVGSPGGLGVREFVISSFASGENEIARFALVATVTRLCSMIGDLLSFLFGVGYGRIVKNNG